jgi:O-antigen/teichoic acid export membrane protein
VAPVESVVAERRLVSVLFAASVATTLAALHAAAQLGRLWPTIRMESLRKLLRFGLVGYLGSLTSFVNYRFDVLLVNVFAGARQVGLYAVGVGLAEVVWYLANAAGIVLAPKVASSDLKDADRMTESVCRVVTGLAIVAGLGLSVFSPFAITLFFGTEFIESTWAVWLLLPGIVTFSVARVLSMYLLGRNKLKIDLLASACGLVVTLALDLLLIPSFGFRGAAIASSVAYTCTMLVSLTWVTHRSTISLRNLLVARPEDVRLLWSRLREASSAVATRRKVSGA